MYVLKLYDEMFWLIILTNFIIIGYLLLVQYQTSEKKKPPNDVMMTKYKFLNNQHWGKKDIRLFIKVTIARVIVSFMSKNYLTDGCSNHQKIMNEKEEEGLSITLSMIWYSTVLWSMHMILWCYLDYDMITSSQITNLAIQTTT